jgi:hypothetical protein
MEETVGPVPYMREGATSRVMAPNSPYCKFYDSYSVSLEYFGCTLVFIFQFLFIYMYIYIYIYIYALIIT